MGLDFICGKLVGPRFDLRSAHTPAAHGDRDAYKLLPHPSTAANSRTEPKRTTCIPLYSVSGALHVVPDGCEDNDVIAFGAKHNEQKLGQQLDQFKGQ